MLQTCAVRSKVIHRASKKEPDLFGQGGVLSANKTAHATVSRCSRDRSRALRAQRLRLIRAPRTELSLDNAIACLCSSCGGSKHRLTVRFTEEHVAHLEALAEASGLTRNEVMRRVLLNAGFQARELDKRFKISSRIQREQNRLGGLLKKALTEREEKAELRRTLVEVERNAVELRRVIAHLVRSR